MQRRLLLLLIGIISIGIAYRLFPFLISGHPFIPDALVHNLVSDSIIQSGRLPTALLDPADWRWPLTSLFIAILSLMTGLPTSLVSGFVFPLIGSLSIPLMFFFAQKTTNNDYIALLSALYIALCGPYIIRGAGVSKETLGHPMLFLIFYTYICGRENNNRSYYVLSFIILVGLIITHHITLVFTALILFLFTIIINVMEVLQGVHSKLRIKNDLILLMLALLASISYYIVSNAYNYFSGRLDIITTSVTAAAFLFVLGVGSVYFLTEERTTQSEAASLLILLIIAIVVFITSVFTEIVPYGSVSPEVAIELAPVMVIGIVSTLGYPSIKRSKIPTLGRVATTTWLVVVVTLEGIALFGARTTTFFILLLRTPLFLLPPLIIVFSFIIIQVNERITHYRHPKLLRTLLLFWIIIMAPLSANFVFYRTSEKISETDYPSMIIIRGNQDSAFYWIRNHISNDSIFTTDWETHFLVAGISNRSVDVYDAYGYFKGDQHTFSSDYLIISIRMIENGFQIPGSNIQRLPKSPDIFSEFTTNTQLNLIYSDQLFFIYEINI